MGTTVFRIRIELIFRRCWNLVTPSRSCRGRRGPRSAPQNVDAQPDRLACNRLAPICDLYPVVRTAVGACNCACFSSLYSNAPPSATKQRPAPKTHIRKRESLPMGGLRKPSVAPSRVKFIEQKCSTHVRASRRAAPFTFQTLFVDRPPARLRAGADRPAPDSPQTEPASVSPASPAIGRLVVISLIVANLRAGKRTVPGAYCDLWMIPQSSYIPIRIRELGTGNWCSEAKGLPMANPPIRKRRPTRRLGRL
jgi:hypothetical protein